MRKAKKRKSEKIEKKAGKWKTLREKIKKYIESFFFNFVLLYLFFYYFFAFRVSEKFRRSVCEFSLQTLSQFLWKPLLTLYVFLSLSFFYYFSFLFVCSGLSVSVSVSASASEYAYSDGWSSENLCEVVGRWLGSGYDDEIWADWFFFFFFFLLRFGGISFNVL